jgi:hypothetical protein
MTALLIAPRDRSWSRSASSVDACLFLDRSRRICGRKLLVDYKTMAFRFQLDDNPLFDDLRVMIITVPPGSSIEGLSQQFEQFEQ